MKNKELNLLPENVRFDINKYILVKRAMIVILFNIIFLMLITLNLILEKNFLNNKIKEEEIKLNRMSAIVEKFRIYQNKYEKLLKKLNYLNKKKELYYISNKNQFSSFLSFLVLGKCVTEGIKIAKLSYLNGEFVVNGISDTSKSFYKFYNTLNDDKLVKKVNFYYLEQKKNLEEFRFKISVLLKEIK